MLARPDTPFSRIASTSAISPLPFLGPVGAVRIAIVEGEQIHMLSDGAWCSADGTVQRVEEKATLMRKLGKKQLTLQLETPLASIPASLADYGLELANDNGELIYTYDAEREKSSIVALKPHGKGLVIETLRYADEVQKPDAYFADVPDVKPDQELLSYQYLQMLPKLAEGTSNKVFMIPSEFSQAVGQIGAQISNAAAGDHKRPE